MGASPAMTVVLATELPGASGGLATAASVAVACASAPARAVLFVEVGAEGRRGPTMLAAASARDVEERLRAGGRVAAARGRLCWVPVEGEGEWCEQLTSVLELAGVIDVALVRLPAREWRRALTAGWGRGAAALVHADLPRQRALAALMARELLGAGMCVRISSVAPGRVGARRAMAGIEAGGEAGRRAARIARALAPGDAPACPSSSPLRETAIRHA